MIRSCFDGYIVPFRMERFLAFFISFSFGIAAFL
jgi:hypothetical protein